MDNQSTRKSNAQFYSDADRPRRVTGIVPERMIALRKAMGWSQNELARRAKVGQSTINRLEAGDTNYPRNVYEIARVLGTTADYLLGKTDDAGRIEFEGSPSDLDELAHMGAADRQLVYNGPPRESDDIEIDLVDFAYGLGGTFLDVGDAQVEKATFSRRWLRHFTDKPPELLGSATGVGDSMEPVISDRDVVIFERGARLEEHLSDKMWVFAFGQIGMIKRLRPMPDGTIKIISANRDVPEEIAVEGDIHIIGRVVCVCKRH